MSLDRPPMTCFMVFLLVFACCYWVRYLRSLLPMARMSESPRGVCDTWPGGKRSCPDAAPFPQDKTRGVPGVLTAQPYPILHARVVGCCWRLSHFILSRGQTRPAAELHDFIHFGGSPLGIWPFLDHEPAVQHSWRMTAVMRRLITNLT